MVVVIRRFGRHWWPKSRPPFRQASTIGFRYIDSSQIIEEEQLPFYKPEQFYPVHIGETFNSKYQVVGKLGWGAYSTTWLCRDLHAHRYIALKVCTQEPSDNIGPSSVGREVAAYDHLSTIKTSHVGALLIRELLDSFEVQGPAGIHRCLVHPPMHMTLDEFQTIGKHGRLNERMLSLTLYNLFHALDFLHKEAHIVHTDIKASNIMMTIDDESMLSNFEETEREDPAPRKIVDDNRTVYMSRSFRFPKDGLWGHPVLCDFGEARIGRFHHGRVQNKLYRAPEVTFELEPGWSFGIDIWSTACMIWDIFENKFLFNGFDEESKYSLSHHIAEMAAFVGLPSPEYAQRSSDIMKKCFTPEGRWLGRGGVTVPSITLEDSEENLEGEDKALFLEFVRSMLQWAPEERKMAKQLLEHPWLTKNLNE